MIILKNLKTLSHTKKYQTFCIILVTFNILAFFFGNYTFSEDLTFDWFCVYGDLFYNVFGENQKIGWIVTWIYYFSFFIFPLTGILFVFKKKNRKFLIANIILQTIGLLSQIAYICDYLVVTLSDYFGYGDYYWTYPFPPYSWWYGDSPWMKTLGYLLNLILGILLYRYYKKHQTDIDRTSFKSYYIVCIICIILSIALGILYGYVWYNYLDPTRFFFDD